MTLSTQDILDYVDLFVGTVSSSQWWRSLTRCALVKCLSPVDENESNGPWFLQWKMLMHLWRKSVVDERAKNDFVQVFIVDKWATQVEHARQETAGSNEIPVISWQQYSHEWIRWPDLFGFCGNRQEPATTGNRIRSPVHCIRFLPFSEGIPAKYCTFPGGFHRKCMGILLPGNIDLGTVVQNDDWEHFPVSKMHRA